LRSPGIVSAAVGDLYKTLYKSGYNELMAGKVLITLALAAALIAASGYYIIQRENTAASLTGITSLTQIQGASATECTFPDGAYGTGANGAMYIYNNEIRVDIEYLFIPNFSGNLQAVIGTDGTRLIDPSSVQAGGTVNAATILNTVITQAPWKCSPWWFPDASLFNIPGAVSF
jgi:hypothetical protein